jgi:hypothetical protein
MRVKQRVSHQAKPVTAVKTSAPVYREYVEDEEEEAEADKLLDPEIVDFGVTKAVKSKKPAQKAVMLQKAARKTGPGGKGPSSDKPARDNLKIPNKKWFRPVRARRVPACQ